jgi:23S rRNA (cytidine2498-2'-O)-methyltransferase
MEQESGRPAPETIGFVCCQGWEPALVDELAGHDPASTPSAPARGVVLARSTPSVRSADLTFARQWLPDPVVGEAPSVKGLVNHIVARVDETIGPARVPWSLAISTPDPYTAGGASYATIESRAALVRDTFLERMETYRRRTFERLTPWPAGCGHDRGHAFLQVLLVARERIVLSVSARFALAGGRTVPCLWTGGARVPEDAQAPSRSYYKLEEAFLETGHAPGPEDRCVDLGAAPGGWTYAALKRGAQVIAVDAVDLAPHVEGNPRCDHRRENGYAFMPAAPVDWLFCDMIVKPLATLGLLERWLAAGACRRFVVTLKFRGRQLGALLKRAADLARRFGLGSLTTRHLYYAGNEVTLLGRVAPPP